jgi:DNA-3-methyladenine glycosylase I
MVQDEQPRCGWVSSDPLSLRYHDEEWGVPLHDDRRLFEFLVLEGAQAGLSWLTILRKRPAYRAAFARFAPRAVAAFGAGDVRRLLADAGIVRNRMKIEAAIANARGVLAAKREYGSFDRFVWSFTGGRTLVNRWHRQADLPTATDHSRAMSAALRQRGFQFVGPTICYAFMQAVGIVNDHLVDCYRHRELAS